MHVNVLSINTAPKEENQESADMELKTTDLGMGAEETKGGFSGGQFDGGGFFNGDY